MLSDVLYSLSKSFSMGGGIDRGQGSPACDMTKSNLIDRSQQNLPALW